MDYLARAGPSREAVNDSSGWGCTPTHQGRTGLGAPSCSPGPTGDQASLSPAQLQAFPTIPVTHVPPRVLSVQETLAEHHLCARLCARLHTRNHPQKRGCEQGGLRAQ